MLTVRNLRRPGLSVPALDVEGGKCVAIMGPSGAGKTLLLRAIADLDVNDGEVCAAGLERLATPAPVWRRTVAYLPAESGWWAETVGDHFSDRSRAAAMLAALKLDPGAFDWPISRLSTGEKQRLALARLLAPEPPVLLLDEPTAALDAEATAAVEEILKQRLGLGAAMLFVTHNQEQARRLAAPIVRIENGEFVESGAPRADV